MRVPEYGTYLIYLSFGFAQIYFQFQTKMISSMRNILQIRTAVVHIYIHTAYTEVFHPPNPSLENYKQTVKAKYNVVFCPSSKY